MIDQVIEKDIPKDEKLVNIFGIVPYHDPFWSGALEEIDRILSGLGLKVNTFFTKHQNMEDIRNCSAAAQNIIVNPWLFKGPAKKFEDKFGVPSIRIPGLFVGATDTTRFVRAVADTNNAVPPKVLFLTDRYEINKAIREEEKEITLLVGSSNEREIALEKDIQFILGAFPMNERLVFNRTYAGYRGSLTFTEDIYDNN